MNRTLTIALLLAALGLASCGISQPVVVWLDETDLSQMSSGWRRPKANKSVEGNPLLVAGLRYERGVGTHADSRAVIPLYGKALRFSSLVGVDDEKSGTVEFVVSSENGVMWRSGVMEKGDAAKKIDLDLIGLKSLHLQVDDGGNGIGQDHADWCMAKIVFKEKPKMASQTWIPRHPLAELKKAQTALIPYPQECKWTNKLFASSGGVLNLAFLQEDIQAVGNTLRLLKEIFSEYNIQIKSKAVTSKAELAKSDISLSLNMPSKNPEEYKLTVTQDGISIVAPEATGLFYGAQTLKQLLEKRGETLFAHTCEIHDWPAFKIRGFMHDVGRNFQTIENLKKQIDVFAAYKLNVFHWHLTDNPAWRIESKKYPQLNDARNHRDKRDQGAFYTYNQIRELIAYCDERHIMVIPELDMPGHSQYFKKTFGFDMASPRGMEVLENAMAEFFEEIPAESCPYLHIGSDEVHIKDPKGFIARMSGFVVKHGRVPIIWDPGLKGDENTVTQLWKGDFKEWGAGIDSAGGYLNSIDPLQIVKRYFFQQPCRAVKGDGKKLGGILCCWPDVRVEDKQNILRHNPVYPALLSFSEYIWLSNHSPKHEYRGKYPSEDSVEFMSFVEFENRLIEHRNRYFEGKPFYYARCSNIPWRLVGPFPHDGDGTKSFEPERAIKESYLVDGKTLSWQESRGGYVTLDEIGRGGGAAANKVTAYALTYIHSDEARRVSAWVGFEYPARAQRQYGGIPKLGEWCPHGGNIWINDTQLAPPRWEQPGANRNVNGPTWHKPANEIPYTDEEFYWTRKPVEINLKEGWNKILLRIPIGYKEQKWGFAFVPVTTTKMGCFREIEGLRYSNELNPYVE